MLDNALASRWIGIGAISGAIAVIMGAFGAHALSARLSQRALEIYQTAAQYQMYHALALIGFGLWCSRVNSEPSLAMALCGWAFTLGILIFSGSLYALALTDVKILGAITPIGGLSLIIAWSLFAYLALQGSRG